jgi:hypothetical protein
MYYFDNKTLAQYLDQNIELEIFVEDEWYKIADLSDVSSPKLGVAYDLYGASHRFDYREIEQIKAGTNIVTLDALQTQKGSKPAEEPAKGKSVKPADDASLDDEPIEDEEPVPNGKKEPDLSWFSPVYDVGRQLMRENNKRKKVKQ